MKIRKVVCSQCGEQIGTAIGDRDYIPGFLPTSAYNSEPISSISVAYTMNRIESYNIYCSNCRTEGDI